MKLPVIQIAGVKCLDEAMMIAGLGATHLGFPFGLDVHQEDTTLDEAIGIIRKLPPHIKPVLITYHNSAHTISDLMKKMFLGIVQIHGDIRTRELVSLRGFIPGIEIWKSLVIRRDNVLELYDRVKESEHLVDAFITDTYDPQTGASGATGKTHDWRISRKLVEATQKPVIIAGGLNPENVREAIFTIRPAGVDVHTGVEGPDGMKTEEKVREFILNAQQAFNELDQG